MRVIGPNCLGVMRPVSGLNATFAGQNREAWLRRIHQSEWRASDFYP
jgi:acyl-CoA synthetase (NDP forming)